MSARRYAQPAVPKEELIRDEPRMATEKMHSYGAGYDTGNQAQDRINKYVSSNALNQAGADEPFYNNRPDFYEQAAKSVPFNQVAMQERIDQSPLISNARSEVQFGDLYGDYKNFHRMGLEFKMPGSLDKVKSNAGDIAEDMADRIDSV